MFTTQVIHSDCKHHRRLLVMTKNIKHFTILSLFLAFAVILGYVEYLIPFDFGIYGFKLGLSNISTVILLYIVGAKSTVAVLFLRIFIVNIIFGTGFSMIFSLIAGTGSFLVMFLLKKFLKSNIIFTSAIGGIVHNVIQIFVACFLVETVYVLYLLPMLILLGLFTGIVIGFVSKVIYKKINTYIKKCYN